MSWSDFTPFASTLGGMLVGLSALWLLVAHGRIAGISGIFGSLVAAPRWDATWRVAFVVGLITAGAFAAWLAPGALAASTGRSTLVVAVAGLLVGFGTRLGSGCTSGHGICGMGRLSPRSLVATATFMATGILTAWAFRTFGGG